MTQYYQHPEFRHECVDGQDSHKVDIQEVFLGADRLPTLRNFL